MPWFFIFIFFLGPHSFAAICNSVFTEDQLKVLNQTMSDPAFSEWPLEPSKSVVNKFQDSLSPLMPVTVDERVKLLKNLEKELALEDRLVSEIRHSSPPQVFTNDLLEKLSLQSALTKKSGDDFVLLAVLKKFREEHPIPRFDKPRLPSETRTEIQKILDSPEAAAFPFAYYEIKIQRLVELIEPFVMKDPRQRQVWVKDVLGDYESRWIEYEKEKDLYFAKDLAEALSRQGALGKQKDGSYPLLKLFDTP